jgi:hypothetical protein
MSHLGKSGSRRSGEKFQKSSHDKSKSKKQRSKSSAKYIEEGQDESAQSIAEKTLSSLNKLGIQTFALSPFSQYFDDWLVNVRQVVSEFESFYNLKPDEIFVKERMQLLADVEGELAKIRLRETELRTVYSTLGENNHLLVETDSGYAEKTRDLTAKRNDEISILIKRVQELEQNLEGVEKLKTSIFGLSKKAKESKKAEATRVLKVAKIELEVSLQNFTVEQEKLHDEYEKTKQSIIGRVQQLEKTVAALETDPSAEPRKSFANALTSAMKSFIERKTVPTQNPQ